MIYQVLAQMVATMQDADLGINVEVDSVEDEADVVLPTIKEANIYGLDAPVNVDTVNTPAFVLTPISTATERNHSGHVQDSVYSVGIEYVNDEVDEEEWRADASHMLHALCRWLYKFNASNATRIGDSGVILVQGWRADFVTWSDAPNRRHGFAMQAEIVARDTFG